MPAQQIHLEGNSNKMTKTQLLITTYLPLSHKLQTCPSPVFPIIYSGNSILLVINQTLQASSLMSFLLLNSTQNLSANSICCTFRTYPELSNTQVHTYTRDVLPIDLPKPDITIMLEWWYMYRQIHIRLQYANAQAKTITAIFPDKLFNPDLSLFHHLTAAY